MFQSIIKAIDPMLHCFLDVSLVTYELECKKMRRSAEFYTFVKSIMSVVEKANLRDKSPGAPDLKLPLLAQVRIVLVEPTHPGNIG